MQSQQEDVGKVFFGEGGQIIRIEHFVIVYLPVSDRIYLFRKYLKIEIQLCRSGLPPLLVHVL